MAIKVYGIATYNGQRVTLALLEKQVEDFELVKVDMLAGEHKKPFFLAMQPFHQIPVFEEDGFYLYESRAIVRHIAQKYAAQGPPLLGNTLREQASVHQWVEVEVHHFNPTFAALSTEFYQSYEQKKPLDEELVAQLTAKLETVLDIFDAQLSKNKYLAGEFYSIADVGIAPSLLRLRTIKPELIFGRKHVKAWYDDITSRPAFKKMLEADAAWPFPYGPFLT